MSERQAPMRIECPFIDTCNAEIDQCQFESYCRELAAVPHQPNYLGCGAYKKNMGSPRMWMQRALGAVDDQGQGQARTRGGHGV